MTDAFVLADHALHLTDGLEIHAHACDAAYWLDRERPELGRGRIVSVFSYESTWDFCERHPTGDELAYVVVGDIDLLLDGGGGELAVRLGAGDAGIVPAGAWHRLAVHTACTVVFITPVPALTEHRPVPA